MKRRGKDVRGVNLFDLRQSEHDLPSIVCSLRFLTRVTFQVDRFEIFVPSELWFKIAQIRDLVIICLRTGSIHLALYPGRAVRLTQNSSRLLRCAMFSMRGIWLFPMSSTRSLI